MDFKDLFLRYRIQTSMLAHAFNPNTGESEQGGPESEASLSKYKEINNETGYRFWIRNTKSSIVN